MVLRSETDEQQLRNFTVGQFHRVLRGANLTGAYYFWEALQQVVAPDQVTTLYEAAEWRNKLECLVQITPPYFLTKCTLCRDKNAVSSLNE